MTNLKLEDSNKFCFFKGDYIGLKSKIYDSNVIDFKSLIGGNFNNSVLKKMNNWEYDKIINHFVELFGYKEIQIKRVFNKRIEEGKLKFTLDNKLIYE